MPSFHVLARSTALAAAVPSFATPDAPFNAADFDHTRVLRNAAKYLSAEPVTAAQGLDRGHPGDWQLRRPRPNASSRRVLDPKNGSWNSV
jgi:hypothetical protein